MRWVGPLVAAAATSACKQREPDIGRNLPSNIKEASELFDARVKAIYPMGTSEERLIANLRKQGFVPSSLRKDWGRAVFTQKSLLVNTIWTVSWQAENGKIVLIRGSYHLLGP